MNLNRDLTRTKYTCGNQSDLSDQDDRETQDEFSVHDDFPSIVQQC